jgi:hypothetical protein
MASIDVCNGTVSPGYHNRRSAFVSCDWSTLPGLVVNWTGWAEVGSIRTLLRTEQSSSGILQSGGWSVYQHSSRMDNHQALHIDDHNQEYNIHIHMSERLSSW